jgi:ferrous iron transport protein A
MIHGPSHPGAGHGVFPLSAATDDQEVLLVHIEGGRGVRNRLNDMGLNEGVRMRVFQARRRGPCIVGIGGLRFALGRGITHRLLVRKA